MITKDSCRGNPEKTELDWFASKLRNGPVTEVNACYTLSSIVHLVNSFLSVM